MPALKDSVKDAARGRWVDILCALGGLSSSILDGKHHPCPKCGGTDRFRMIDTEAGALLCNQCFDKANGDGIAALSWLQGWDFKECLHRLAEHLGIKSTRPSGPDKDLEFEEWNDEVVRLWCLTKTGINPEAVKAFGGRLARWKRNLSVLSIPILGVVSPKPTGYVIWNLTGAPIQKADGTTSKILVTKDSRTGWIGEVERITSGITSSEIAWKVEGPTDAMALWSAMPPEDRAQAVVISNPFGSTEKPRLDLLNLVKDKVVYVCHDLDEAGARGGQRWAEAMAKVAKEVRVVKLPSGQGKDVRDFIAAGGTYAQLLALAQAAAVLKVDKEITSAAFVTEANDDPARLARKFLEKCGYRLAYWREDFYRWISGKWEIYSDDELRSDLVISIKEEFDNLYMDAVAEGKIKEVDNTTAIKLSDRIVYGTLTCLKAFTCVASAIEWGSEIKFNGASFKVTKGEPKRWIALENGILKAEDYLEGDGCTLLDHTPTWWSPHKLEYRFEPRFTIEENAPRWNAFLQHNLQGDKERIAILQEWCGYCLLPRTDLQAFLILEGEGSNGKSVYCAVLEALLGSENVSHVPLELFGERFQLAPTMGKLANIITEVGELDRVAEGILKAYTDGSGITVDRKGREPINGRPTARLVIATNNRPRFSDRSIGLWRRMLLVPWYVEIKPEERVSGMDKPEWWIHETKEMPAILSWAIAGLARLDVFHQFTKSKESQAAMDEYRIEVNPAREFLIEHLEEAEGESVAADLVYPAYQKWCERHGYKGVLGARQFGKEIKRVFRSSFRYRTGARETRSWAYKNIRGIINLSGIFL